MVDFIIYALAFGLLTCLASMALGLLLLPVYLWVRHCDAMAELESRRS